MRRGLTAVLLAAALALGGCGAGQKSQAASAATEVQPDGTYEPAAFRWEGGSGRIELSCDAVTIKDGAATARITFSSPNYDYVRVGEQKLTGDYTDQTSVFEVPVTLDEETELIACTTAMSKPHEITYTIFVSLDRNQAGQQSAKPGTTKAEDQEIREKVRAAAEADDKRVPPSVEGLTYERRMELMHAKCFDVFYYEGGYKVLSVIDGSSYLIVPEGAAVPETLPDGMTPLLQPLSEIYVAATSAMSLFDSIGALENVKLSGTDADGWAIEAPKAAISDGRMTYAGKYSEPDYELLVSSGCDLAVESTMILHAPEVREQLQTLGIPVLTDWSSYEKDVFGRMEWIRAYGALTNRESEADAHFRAECEAVGDGWGYEASGKTVAYLAVNSRKMAAVPRRDDYIADMIRMGGAAYAFADADDGGRSGTSIDLSMEECYRDAADADILIYNGNIGGDVASLADLIAKNELFADFRAVREGRVYLSDSRLYQSSDSAVEFVNDVHRLVTEEDPEHLTFLTKLT